jgi:hypothetical protein
MTRHLDHWMVRATIAILLLSITSALLGLFRPDHYRETAAIVELNRVQDATILLAGVPVLAIGLWYAARGSLRGRIAWLGGLVYMSYMWANIGLATAFNELFLVYVALFGLSTFTLVGGLLATDPDTVADALGEHVSRPLYAGVLAVIAGGLATLWLAELVPATLSGQAPLIVAERGPMALVSHFIDLSLVVPALLLAAVWLRRDHRWGPLVAGVMLVFGATVGVSITAMTLTIAAGDAITLSPVAAVFTFLPVLLAAVLAWRYLGSLRPSGPGGRAAG